MVGFGHVLDMQQFRMVCFKGNSGDFTLDTSRYVPTYICNNNNEAPSTVIGTANGTGYVLHHTNLHVRIFSGRHHSQQVCKYYQHGHSINV